MQKTMTLSPRFVLSFSPRRSTSYAHRNPFNQNRIFQANKKADKDGQLIQDLQRTIQDLKKDLTKSNEKVRLYLTRSHEAIFTHMHIWHKKIMDLQKDLDTPRTVSPQTASPVSAQATMQQPQQVPFNPFLAMQQQAMQQQALQLQAFKGTPYEGMMMPGTTPNPAMAMNPFAFMPAGMMDPMSLMMMMSKMMPMVQYLLGILYNSKSITKNCSDANGKYARDVKPRSEN